MDSELPMVEANEAQRGVVCNLLYKAQPQLILGEGLSSVRHFNLELVQREYVCDDERPKPEACGVEGVVMLHGSAS